MKLIATLFGIAAQLIAEQPMQTALKQAAMINRVSERPNLLLQEEKSYCVLESWEEGGVNEASQRTIPGLSGDLLHPLRRFFEKKPKTSLHFFTIGSGYSRITAAIFTIRLPNLRGYKTPKAAY